MEKEEKIEQAAKKQNQFNRMSSLFGLIGFTLMTLLKVVCCRYFGVSATAYSLVYPIMCLNVVGGDWGTMIVTAIV